VLTALLAIPVLPALGWRALAKILAGVEQPDGGSLEMDGEPIRFTGPRDARAKGVAVVSQELSLFPDLDVLGNLFPLDRRPALACSTATP
jgi:ABC-type sugar transport system ATPase subunit